MTLKTVAQLTGKSLSHIKRVSSGIVSDQYVETLIAEDEDAVFRKIISDPLIGDIMELAIMKGKTKEIRLLAARIFQLNQRLRRPL